MNSRIALAAGIFAGILSGLIFHFAFQFDRLPSVVIALAIALASTALTLLNSRRQADGGSRKLDWKLLVVLAPLAFLVFTEWVEEKNENRRAGFSEAHKLCTEASARIESDEEFQDFLSRNNLRADPPPRSATEEGCQAAIRWRNKHGDVTPTPEIVSSPNP
ncbi:MAG: hypothetical protein KY429_02870 [Actinobacteria bacterium]|nr:hypothetical protein [Actinomycetota bacterium]